MQGSPSAEVGPGGRSGVERPAGGDPRRAYQPENRAAASGTQAEIAALRNDIRNLIHAHDYLAHLASVRSPVRHGWLKHIIKGLETDAHIQYKVHFWGSVYWLVNLPGVLVLYFFFPHLWVKIGILITLVYSVYANFATDYGGMSAAMASFSPAVPPEIPLERGTERNQEEEI